MQERLVKVEDVWLQKLEVLRSSAAGATASPDIVSTAPDGASPASVLRLNVSGRLLDKNNPVSKVSQDSYERVKLLLSSFAGSQFISSVEKENFDPKQPGILSFDFILVVNPKKPL